MLTRVSEKAEFADEGGPVEVPRVEEGPCRELEDAPDDAELITMLNYVVVGMIITFAAIMVVNGVAAMLAHRRAELARLELVGATPGQVRASVLLEAGIVATVGVLLGPLASAATVLPFAYARHEGVVPDGQLWAPLAVAAGAAALTLASTRMALHRSAPAVAAG